MRFLMAFGVMGALGTAFVGCSSSDNDVATGTEGAGTGTGASNGSGADAGDGSTGGGSSGGSDTGGSSNTGGSASGTNGTGGNTTGGSSGSNGTDASSGSNTSGSNTSGGDAGEDCTTVQCLRPYECVPECGSDEVTNNGCCPCPEGTVDVLSCPEASITQGIWGEVLWLEGNHMPGPGGPSGTSMPVSREVRVYEPVSQAEATEATDRTDAYGVYSDIDGTLVDSTTSDEDGFYQVELTAGTYSVFVEDEGDWYCNSFSAEGLCTVTVPEGEVVEYNVRIDYAAAY